MSTRTPWGLTRRQKQTLTAAFHRAEAGQSVFSRVGRPRKPKTCVMFTGGFVPQTDGFLAIVARPGLEP